MCVCVCVCVHNCFSKKFLDSARKKVQLSIFVATHMTYENKKKSL